MNRRELLLFAGSMAAGVISSEACSSEEKDKNHSVEDFLAESERKRAEEHKKAARLLFPNFAKYMNTDLDPEFYKYASGLFNSYESLYDAKQTASERAPIHVWVRERNSDEVDRDLYPKEMALYINASENKQILPNLYIRVQSDENIQTANSTFVTLNVDGAGMVARERDSRYGDLNEEEMLNVWSKVFRTPVASFAKEPPNEFIPDKVAYISEGIIVNGENLTYRLNNSGDAQVFASH
jgi:hypothetical protein